MRTNKQKMVNIIVNSVIDSLIEGKSRKQIIREWTSPSGIMNVDNDLIDEIISIANKSEIEEIMKKNAQALGRIKTEKKAKSSRENGKKGGRPKKIK